MNIYLIICLIFFTYFLIISIAKKKVANKKVSNKKVANKKNSNKYESYLNYTKCTKYKNNKIMKDFLKKSQIEKVNKNETWDIYLPCSYTFLENSLDKLIPTNKNQKIFGIRGCDNLAAKDRLWNTILKKYGRNKAKQYMPDTYDLNDNYQMNEFKKNYKIGKTYLLKKNIQRKEGIEITNNFNTIIKAKNKGFVIVQNYLDDLYLINKRKINLRMYLLITCHNNKIKWYISNLGKCIYTNKDFNKNDLLDYEKHLTSLNLNTDIYDNNPLTLADLKTHLGSYNYNKLFANIMLILKKCKNSFNNLICSDLRFRENLMFQLFGLDFVFTSNFKAYLLEMNKGPQMKFFNKIEKKLKMKVIEDLFAKVGIGNINNNSFIKI